MESPNHPHQRRIRSFVRRPGRITESQQRALLDIWPHYGLPNDEPLDLDRCFGRRAKRILEIGFGNGEVLAQLAADHPQLDYLGLEVHEPGIGHLLLLLAEKQLSNVRLANADAVEFLANCIPAGSLSAVNVFFPDPWPKKRHHKRRLIQTDFLTSLARCLPAGGGLHLATDWPNYAEHMVATLNELPLFEEIAATAIGEDPIWERRTTKFERRGLALGHPVVDLYYRRTEVNP
jgi:tRNA (guanine-N7-)-methyltransferase